MVEAMTGKAEQIKIILLGNCRLALLTEDSYVNLAPVFVHTNLAICARGPLGSQSHIGMLLEVIAALFEIDFKGFDSLFDFLRSESWDNDGFHNSKTGKTKSAGRPMVRENPLRLTVRRRPARWI